MALSNKTCFLLGLQLAAEGAQTLGQDTVHWKGAKGHTHKGHRENVLKAKKLRLFSGCFQGVLRYLQGVFSECFALCPFWVCS